MCGALILTACGGDKDEGVSNKIIQSEQTLTFGSTACWLGGTEKSSGVDKNNNGVLDENEVEKTETSCLSKNVFESGMRLDYEVMDNLKGIADGAKAGNTIEVRRGGFERQVGIDVDEIAGQIVVLLLVSLFAFHPSGKT